MARRTATLRAIVLGRSDFGEADRVVRLLTPERGRLAAFARGARRSRRRFGGALDPTHRVEVVLAWGRGELPEVREAVLVRGHPHLRSRLEGLALATYAVELVGGLAREHAPEPRLFGLLEVALLVLDGCATGPGAVFRWGLEAKALAFGGLMPALSSCAVCGRGLDAGVWAAASGGMAHPSCATGPLAPAGWRRQVERALRTPLAELVDVVPEPGPSRALAALAEWHLGRRLAALDLLPGTEGG